MSWNPSKHSLICIKFRQPDEQWSVCLLWFLLVYTLWALWMCWFVLAGFNPAVSMSVEVGLVTMAIAFFFPHRDGPTAAEMHRERERRGSLRSTLKQKTDGFSSPGLGWVHCYWIKKYRKTQIQNILPINPRVCYCVMLMSALHGLFSVLHKNTPICHARLIKNSQWKNMLFGAIKSKTLI